MKSPYKHYVNVIYNPDGFCIDSRAAQTLEEIKHKNDIIDRPDLSYTPRLPPINVSPISSSSRIEDCKVVYEDGALLADHEKQWLVNESVPELNDIYWNRRSNDFLLSYYDHLDKRNNIVTDENETELFSPTTISPIKNHKKYQLYENIYHGDTISVTDVTRPKKISSRHTFDTTCFKKLPLSLRSENDKATCWLRSYVNVAHAQKVNWCHVLDAAGDLINHSKKMK